VPEVIDVDIRELNADGDGIPRQRDPQFVVPFTIPGERVRVRVDRDGHVATLLEILRPSSFRITPRCPHFGPCGGCAWQHIAYAEQLRLKAALVDRLIRQRIPDAPAVNPTVGSGNVGADSSRPDTPWGYRQKVHFVFGMSEAGSGIGDQGPGRDRGADAVPQGRRTGRRTLTMGHYARGSRRIVPVRECPVHDERGNAVAFQFAASLRAAGVEAAVPTSPRRGTTRDAAGTLRSMAVRVALHGTELMTTIVARDDTDKRLRTATRRACTHDGAPTSLHLNLHPRGDRFIFGPDTRTISGHARLRESVAGTSFLISPTAFFQTNVRAAEVLVELVRTAAPPEALVLDLYAGAGLFALPLARDGHRVTAVEENRAAVADGEASRRVNRISEERCRFITQPVETALRRLPPSDVIVLDPPRSGCSPAVLEQLCRHRREATIVYVSCNAEALARDLEALTRSRFRIRSIQPVDMFPHTAHVETVVVLDGSDPVRR
jgi:23S rRNA (uracil1939-C5)-methyltransferase